MASNEAEDMVNGVENEEVDVSIEENLHENSDGSRFKWLDSLDLELSRVSRMSTHRSVSITNKMHLYYVIRLGTLLYLYNSLECLLMARLV